MTTTVSKQQLDDGVMHVVSREFGLPHHRLASALVRVTQRSASRITVSTTVRGLRHFPSPTSDVETVVAIAEEWLDAWIASCECHIRSVW